MMRDCEDGNMRDLLPGRVHGTLSAQESASVEAHLESCADCVAELDLIERASRALRAPEVDIGRIVQGLPAARGSARRGAMRPVWRLAAAIAIVALGAISVVALRGYFGRGANETLIAPTPAASTALAAAAPPSAPAQVDSARVDSAAVSANPRSGISFGGGISDLTEDQLNTLLGELDGLQALPSAEPESHLTPIVPMVDEGNRAH